MELRATLKDFNDDVFVKEYADQSGLIDLFNLNCSFTHKENPQADLLRTVDPNEIEPYKPELNDLCRLHWLATSRKSCQILEFGSGYSTLILADAMRINEEKHLNWAKSNLRIEEPFTIHSLEESSSYMQITQTRLGALEKYVKLAHSKVFLTEFRGNYVTFYEEVPNILPDLIYLDGPSQYAAKNIINGFSINTPFRMPMSADILRLEFFLEPGTLIIVDGRGANANLLKRELKRNWKYFFDQVGDVHLFELQDEFFGKLNKIKFNYCLNDGWLLK